jgi:hypothetical protein
VKSRRAIDLPGLIVELAILLVATWFVLRLNPAGFGGGPFDDQRYFDAARAWIDRPPLVARTHWDLRHPLILPLAALFAIKGPTIAIGLLLPVAAALAFAGISFAAIRQAAGSRAAWLWALIFLTTPLFLRIGTSIFPEILELLFVSGALWSLWFGRQTRYPARLFAVSGLCAAMAIMTRETAAWLLFVYAICLIFRPGVRRGQYAWIVAFAAAPLLIEWAWLFYRTGDPLYRLHVSMHHVAVPSANMIGGVAHVDHVLFNPAVGRLWIAPGLFHIHWALNPLLGLFADPKYGLAIWGAILFALLPARRGRARRTGGRPALIVPSLLIAVLSFVFVTYVLMVSQDQRYYATALCGIALIAALLGDRLWSAGRPLLVAVVAVVIVLSNLALATQSGRFDYAAPVAMPLVRSTGETIHATAMTAGQLRQPLAEAGLAGRVVATPTPSGGLQMIVQGGGLGCGDTVALPPGQKVIGCRASAPPLFVRWIKRFLPRVHLPAALTKSGTRALLVRTR